MATEKISQLPAKNVPVDTDTVPIVDNSTNPGTTSKTTRANLLTASPQLSGTYTTGTFTNPTVSGMRSWDGWEDANESWTYSSWDSTNVTGVITVPTNAVVRYSPGMRVRLDQTTRLYGIITAVAATSITVYFGTDYTFANAAITAPCFSGNKAPLGFPLSPLKWTQITTDTSDRTTTGQTYTNVGSVSLSVPIGAWKLNWQGTFKVTRTSTTFASGNACLSATNNSADDLTMVIYMDISGATGTLESDVPFYREKNVSVTTATSYYQNITSGASSITAGVTGSSGSTTAIKAVCAYL